MYVIEYMECDMSANTKNSMETMDAQERILYVAERLSEEACTSKQLSLEIFGTDEAKKVRLIQSDIKLLKERYPGKIYVPSKGYNKFLNLPDFMEKLMSSDAEELSNLFEFIALFDAKMLRLFEESEPTLLKKLKREARSIYYIKDDPIEEIHNKEIWQTLKKAVKEKRYLSLAYEKEKLKAYNSVKPIKIVFAQNNWYLAAINTEEEHAFEFTFFRVSHIIAAKIDAKTFHEDVEALAHLKNLQSMFELYQTKQYKVLLLAKAEIAPYFRNKKYLKSQTIEEIREDGSLVLSFRINNHMEIIPIIKRWLPHLIVLEPSELKKEISTILKAYTYE